MIEHPTISRTLRTGYPQQERVFFTIDGLGNAVFKGDEILELDDQIYLVDEISLDAQEILEKHGAVRRIIHG